MTLPASPASISFSQIQTEYGGSNPISLSEYYGSQSGYVAPGMGIPSSGSISVSSFRSTHKAVMYYRNAQSVTTTGDESVITFSTSGSSGLLRPDFGSLQIRVLIVGPGGTAGAASRAGGGGGGGAIDFSGLSLSSGTDYSVTVGSTVNTYDGYGNITGSTKVNSSIGSVIYATPGGDGTGSGDYGRYAVAGDSGYVVYNGSVIASSYVGGNYNGSGGYKTGTGWGAGGGGGAGGVGVDGLVYNQAAYGGSGIYSQITGVSTLYVGGGGNGSSSCGYLASNGYGGGYAGAYGQKGGNGTPNTGGGSGAGCANAAGAPGNGLVIVRGKFTAIAY